MHFRAKYSLKNNKNNSYHTPKHPLNTPTKKTDNQKKSKNYIPKGPQDTKVWFLNQSITTSILCLCLPHNKKVKKFKMVLYVFYRAISGVNLLLQQYGPAMD